MAKQSEQILEEQLIAQLQKLGYAYFPIADEKINRTATQIEKTELWKKGLLQQMFV